MAWLIDNCGFAHSHVLHGVGLQHRAKLLKSHASVASMLRRTESASWTITLWSSQAYSADRCQRQSFTFDSFPLHNPQFSLYGDIGLKVYDSLKILVNNYETATFFYSMQNAAPDINPVLFQVPFRRRCAVEKFQCLLNRPSDALLKATCIP